jgi:hypothetical protein
MFCRRILAVLGLFCCVAFAPLPAADPDKKSDPPEDKQVVSSKATPRTAVASINFRKELDLPFDSLSTLGARVEAARRKPDPVAMAHAASELATAEKVSGKTASCTSKALMKEAAELAGLRKQVTEMKAVLNVANQVQDEDDSLVNLKQQLTMAQAQAKADQSALTSNEEPTSKPRKVIVNNYTTDSIDIYVNGFFKTNVGPGSSTVIMIEHRWNPTTITGYGNQDVNNYGPRTVWGQFDKYTWNIN